MDIADTVSSAGNGDDINVGPFEIGFTFPFSGDSFSGVRICTNGFIPFTSSPNRFVNAGIPATSQLYAFVVLLRDDLLLLPPSWILYYHDSLGHRFAVTRMEIAVEPVAFFQAILQDDGSILFHYEHVGSAGELSTIGIENPIGTDGLQVSQNQICLHDQLVIV